MSQTSINPLQIALNKVDRERGRAMVLMIALLLMTFGDWIAMMLAKDDHKGLPFGLAAVISSVFVAGIIAAKASHDNTRTILKAIELLSSEKQDA